MKQFLKKVLIFILLPFVIYAISFLYMKRCFRNDLSSHPVIILGDSQTEFIRDPAIFNSSIHGSPYFVHYKFCKQFIEQIKNKKVYISCNYHNFSKRYQNRLVNDSLYKGWRSNMFNHLDDYHIFNYKYGEIRPKDLEYTFISINKYQKLFTQVFLNNETENSMLNISNDTMSIAYSIQNHYNDPAYVLDDSVQQTYLNKLIELLTSNNCEVILLQMPLARYYINNVPIDIKNQLLEIASNHKIRILDLNKELLISGKYEYFKDYGHLNKVGDTIVNEYFRKHELNKLNHN